MKWVRAKQAISKGGEDIFEGEGRLWRGFCRDKATVLKVKEG